MQLIDRYIQAVKFWLPQAQQDDITAELHANLLAQAEEQEAESGQSLSEEDAVTLLKRSGHPALVAARYRMDHGTVSFGRQLIGPLIYPYYRVAIKTTLCILVGIQLLKSADLVINDQRNLVQWVIQGLWSLVDVALLPLLLVTAAFAAIDYALGKYRLADRWDPRSLAPLVPKAVPRAASIAGLVVQFIFIAWWLNLPHFSAVTFGALRPAPIWQTIYLPGLVIALVLFVQHAITLFRPGWTWVPPVVGLATSIVALAIVFPLLTADPLVLVAVDDSTPVAAWKIAKINRSLHYAVLITWIGIAIAAVVDLVKGARIVGSLLGRTENPRRQPVSH